MKLMGIVGKIATCVIASLFISGYAGVKKQEQKPLKVLMIGNSFSICLLSHLPQVAHAYQKPLDLCSMYIGGCSLERHCQNIAKSDDASFKPYKVDWDYELARNEESTLVCKATKFDGKTYRANIPEILKAEKWDVVTIQQASHFSWKKETFEPWGEILIKTIKEYAPSAEIIVQETWSYTPWDKRLKGWGIDQNQMYCALNKTYAEFARKNGLRIIPVGTAVQIYRKALPVKYTENSLGGDPCGKCEFVKNDKGEFIAKGDVFHFNREGEYLQALTWAGVLFGVDPVKCSYQPNGMDATRASVMRSSAKNAIDEIR